MDKKLVEFLIKAKQATKVTKSMNVYSMEESWNDKFC